MTLIPETPIDMSIFDGPGSWNNVIPSNDYHVFSVAELPEPPKLDMDVISGKSSDHKPIPSNKKDIPLIPSLPTSVSVSTPSTVVVKPTDDLYEDDSCPTAEFELPAPLSITLAKAAVSSEILAAHRTSSSTGTWSSLELLCEELDEMCERLSALF